MTFPSSPNNKQLLPAARLPRKVAASLAFSVAGFQFAWIRIGHRSLERNMVKERKDDKGVGEAKGQSMCDSICLNTIANQVRGCVSALVDPKVQIDQHTFKSVACQARWDERWPPLAPAGRVSPRLLLSLLGGLRGNVFSTQNSPKVWIFKTHRNVLFLP